MDQFELQISPHHLCVPYPRIEHQDSINHGFMDLKGSPELVDAIPEASDCPPLKDCLRRINAPSVPFATLGCEKLFQDYAHDEHPQLKRMVRGYVDLCFTRIELNAEKGKFKQLVESFLRWAHERQQFYHSSAEFLLTPTSYGFNGKRIEGFALTIWVNGYGANDRQAMESYGVLLHLFTDYLTGIM